MPLYEIVLRYPDRDEIRLTDYDPRGDGEIRINGSSFPLVDEVQSSTPGVARRYVALVERSDSA